MKFSKNIQSSPVYEDTSVSNIQFLIIYRFTPDPSLVENKQVQVIGVLSYDTIAESFWLSPSHLQTDRTIRGEFYN